MRLTLPWFLYKLSLFTEEQQVIITSMVTKEAYEALTADQQKNLMLLLSYLTSTSTEASRNSVYDYLREVFIEGKGPYIFVINEGEDGRIYETKQSGADYTGFKLVVREDSSNALITDPTLDGSDDPVQIMQYISFPLAKGGIYRLRIQLEYPGLDGDANGNGHLLLSTAYVVVPMKIDQPA